MPKQIIMIYEIENPKNYKIFDLWGEETPIEFKLLVRDLTEQERFWGDNLQNRKDYIFHLGKYKKIIEVYIYKRWVYSPEKQKYVKVKQFLPFKYEFEGETPLFDEEEALAETDRLLEEGRFEEE